MSGLRLLVAGVDEAGRGPLAGPVVAAAVILRDEVEIEGIRDSKQLTPSRRESLARLIREQSLAYALGEADVAEIDALNILKASLLAMSRAVASLAVAPHRVLVDGNHLPQVSCEARAIIGGDRLVPAVSAASILAKVARDAMMVELDRRYPEYGFARHKGYPTKAHREALKSYGPCPVHRRTFAPVRDALEARAGRASPEHVL
ncbi:MAG: ribonuclease HII [Gammaproteobacteria bacterium]|nr:ribonuclease HII [Gammaproteobacteria bacterium]MDH3411042.1 ribonuclease HII [Gammaproteobacteria bacterium]